jgi:hypothetical protein
VAIKGSMKEREYRRGGEFFNMKYSEYDSNNREEITNEINFHWQQFYQIFLAGSETARKQLFVLNGSGAIALMSYLGIITSANQSYIIKLALYFFIWGVIFSTLLTVIQVHTHNYMLEEWSKDMGSFYSDKLDRNMLYERDKKREINNKTNLTNAIFSWFSLSFFIIACLLIIIVFFK